MTRRQPLRGGQPGYAHARVIVYRSSLSRRGGPRVSPRWRSVTVTQPRQAGANAPVDEGAPREHVVPGAAHEREAAHPAGDFGAGAGVALQDLVADEHVVPQQAVGVVVEEVQQVVRAGVLEHAHAEVLRRAALFRGGGGQGGVSWIYAEAETYPVAAPAPLPLDAQRRRGAGST